MFIPALVLGGLILAQIPSVADLPLPDLHGNEDRLASHRDHVVVVMVVTAKRLRNIKPWEKSLRERFDAVQFLRIADLPEDSDATYEQVSKKLRQRVPENVPILIDVDRLWATELELDTDRPNLLVFDREGKLATRVRGRMDPELLDRLCGEIEALVDRP